MRLIIVVLLMALVTAGVWFYQQNKIDKLNTQVTSLDKQVAELKKNGSASQSVTSQLDAVASAARDTERQNDIKSLQSQIEASYAQHGKYPSLSDINDPSWRATNMKGLDESTLKDPKGTKAILDPKPGKLVYAYDVSTIDNNSCNNTAKDCKHYTLTATLENGQTFTKQNLN